MHAKEALCHPGPGYLLTGKLGHFTLDVVASSNLAVLFVPILAVPGFVWLSSWCAWVVGQPGAISLGTHSAD